MKYADSNKWHSILKLLFQNKTDQCLSYPSIVLKQFYSKILTSQKLLSRLFSHSDCFKTNSVFIAIKTVCFETTVLKSGVNRVISKLQGSWSKNKNITFEIFYQKLPNICWRIHQIRDNYKLFAKISLKSRNDINNNNINNLFEL